MLHKFSYFLNSCFQKRCAYCNKSFSKKQKIHGLCENCLSELKRIKTGYCTSCGNIFPMSECAILKESCENCKETQTFWKELKFYNVYEGFLRELIKEAKFNRNLIYLNTLADIMRPVIREFSTFDYIVPIPLHTKRLRDRGYNQCLEIVKRIAKKENLHLLDNALEKTQNTKAQSTLSKDERLENISNSFVANEKVKDKTILLFDDVSTTGTTLRAATKALLDAGAKEVFVCYIAGTAKHE